MEKRPRKPENPDIEFTAAVKARELRFDEVPDTEVHPPARTERENLPDQVHPEHAGITFRNVSVNVRIANQLTRSDSGRWKEIREATSEGPKPKRDSGKPSHAVESENEETPKEKK